jgi:hypothetical protein
VRNTDPHPADRADDAAAWDLVEDDDAPPGDLLPALARLLLSLAERDVQEGADGESGAESSGGSENTRSP